MYLVLKKFLCYALAGLLLQAAPAFSYGAEKRVRVTAADFPITLNGTAVERQDSVYPYLLYKGITYYPMTHYDCSFMGLTADWDARKGLSIRKEPDDYKLYTNYGKGVSNKGALTAVEASFPIEINGERINNEKEEYPLLIFRDVTYFPLTWRFAVEQFGWDYAFDAAGGLRINREDMKGIQEYMDSLIGTKISDPDGNLTLTVTSVEKKLEIANVVPVGSPAETEPFWSENGFNVTLCGTADIHRDLEGKTLHLLRDSERFQGQETLISLSELFYRTAKAGDRLTFRVDVWNGEQRPADEEQRWKLKVEPLWEPWVTEAEKWPMGMGEPGFAFLCMDRYVNFYNMTGKTIELKPVAVTYRISRKNSDGSLTEIGAFELPPVSGTFKNKECLNAAVPEWNGKDAAGIPLPAGSYVGTFDASQVIYRFAGEQEWLTLPGDSILSSGAVEITLMTR